MIEKAGGISADSVRRATGRNWDEWFALLDAENAASLAHPQIARIVSEKFGASDWWSQMVTVAYEQERGLRQKYQKRDGFSASRSKTIGVPLVTLFAAWVDPVQRAMWLPDLHLTLRGATKPKSVRLFFESNTSTVNATFTAKGESRSHVAVEHSRLPDAATSAAMRDEWAAALNRLKQLLESSSAES